MVAIGKRANAQADFRIFADRSIGSIEMTSWINIPEEEGKLTNVRAAKIYEEYLPLVQQAIIDRVVGRRA